MLSSELPSEEGEQLADAARTKPGCSFAEARVRQTMKRFMYRFGYESPIEWRQNLDHGSDFESSSAFWVIADTEEDALAWGWEVSEKMVHEFFVRSGWNEKDTRSWKEAGYAHWIEETPGPEFTEELLAGLLEVKHGEMPSDLSWLMR